MLLKINLKNKSKTIYIISINDKACGTLPVKDLRAFVDCTILQQDISEDNLLLLKEQIEKYSWSKFLDYLSYRERSTRECKLFLKSIYLDDVLIEDFITRVKKLKYLDDNRFAELYVESLLDKGKSKQEIRNKLREKGVNSGEVLNLLDEMYDNCKQDILKKEIEKALRRYASLSDKIKKDKIIAYLYRRGFSYHEVMEQMKIKGDIDD